MKRVVQISLRLLLLWLPCASQSNIRSLTGVVTDKRGNALPGVAVELEDTVTLFVRSYISKQDGRYYFNDLNGDVDYTVRAHYRNYWSKRKTLSKFNSSKACTINLVIPVE